MKGWNDSKSISGVTYVEGVAAGRKAHRQLQDSTSKILGRCVLAQAGRSGTITIDGSRNRSQAIRELTQIESIVFFLRWPRVKGWRASTSSVQGLTEISYFLRTLGPQCLSAGQQIFVFLFLWLAAERWTGVESFRVKRCGTEWLLGKDYSRVP
jgi:hypothetical protein